MQGWQALALRPVIPYPARHRRLSIPSLGASLMAARRCMPIPDVHCADAGVSTEPSCSACPLHRAPGSSH
ncbi:hypothetical protein T492DRAFT_960219 [Pavlovales sp. CCMP2436]|nr:hypothetical protein T492DRAFT_960219 [Pavlovales sp. CCMP2436]